MSWLDPRLWLAAIVVALAVFAGGYWQGHNSGARAVKQQWDVQKSEQAIATQQAEAAQRSIEQARQTEIERITNEAKDQVAVAQADAGTARDASARLQQRVASLVAASRASKDSGAAGRSQSEQGQDPITLLAQLSARADSAAGELAEYADRLKVAGLACERSYGSLTAN